MERECPPEYIIDEPKPQNGFMWTWVVCQPDCNWAELAYGRASTCEEAVRQAQTTRDRIEYHREHRRDKDNKHAVYS
jgi:hypothetical protein